MSKKVYRLPGQYSESQPWRRLGLIGVAIVVISAAGLVALKVVQSNGKSDQPATTAAASTPEIVPVSAEGRYLFSGTIVLGRGVEQQAQRAGGIDYAQPFSQFASFKPEQYDGWLADLECPVTTKTITFRESVDKLKFNCRPEWLPELTKYIKLLNLANNHTYDMGADGFTETQQTLDTAGVQTVGNYLPTVKKDICEVMALPVRVLNSKSEEEAGTLPVAFCAVHYFESAPQPGEMEVLERYAKLMPVFGFMQVGAEYYPNADQKQITIGRKLIDLGSDFVVGNSPHWVQNSEVYKDKLIVYSTGNFIFDQLDAETNRGLNLDVTFKTKHDENLARWLKLGDSCKARGDTCLDQAEKTGLKKIKLDYTFEPVASSGGYKVVTHRADAAVQQAVEQRLDWANTLQKLKQPARR